MNRERISLGHLKFFLLKAADVLRGNLGTSVVKEFILGMPFLERLSDEFDRKREQLRMRGAVRTGSPEVVPLV